MEELISKKDLYDKVVKLEEEALDHVRKLAQSDNAIEWGKMNVALMERTAFKFDVVDAPVILEIPDTGIGDLSDGYHTFNQLYFQRMILFAALVKAYKEKAWKSYRHEDGEYCFGGGWFIVGIDTPEGSYTYHYENKYWDMFDCMDLPRGKHWDGHTEADAETRLMSLNPEPHWIPVTEGLPKKDGRYYVTLENKYVKILYYAIEQTLRHPKGFYYLTEDGRMAWSQTQNPVVAWMPLSEPYKGVTT